MTFETVYKGEPEIVAIFDGMGGCDNGEIASLVSAKASRTCIKDY